jgi:hypothetical protein
VKIEVTIERDPSGRLHGHVLQRREDSDGNEWIVKGDDLLTNTVFKNVDAAVQECDRKLQEMFKLIDPPAITWIFPGIQEGGPYG